MGGSKSNTGIGFVDNAVDYTINKGTNPAAKNVERNAQNVAQGWGRALSGDFNNFDRTLLDTGMFFGTGGVGTVANPDDVGKLTGKETAVERMTIEAQDKAAADALANDQATQAETMRGIASVISGQIGARVRGPGRGATLLTGGAGKGNTLLTINGG